MPLLRHICVCVTSIPNFKTNLTLKSQIQALRLLHILATSCLINHAVIPLVLNKPRTLDQPPVP